jgi:hypothetical protein
VDVREWRLWAGLFAAPAAWLFDLQATYALIPTVCRGAPRPWLFAPWVLAMALASAGLWLTRVGARELRAAPRASARARFVVQAATWASAIFLLLLCAALVPRLLLGACDL